MSLVTLLQPLSSRSTCFHSYPHFEFLHGQISIELCRVLSMLQPLFLQLTLVRIHKRHLLEARTVIRSD